MNKSKISIFVFAVILITQPNLALAGIPDLPQCEVSMAYPGPDTPSMMNVPNGTGNSFTEATDEQGNVVDATITLYIRDGQGVPVVHFPAEDSWLESMDGGMVACASGTVSNFSTDVNGMTQWIYPLFAGGFSQAPVLVLINGDALVESLNLDFMSPDMDGSGVVNLADVAYFAGCYFGSYCFAADMNGDGVVNLSDLSLFASHIGAACP